MQSWKYFNKGITRVIAFFQWHVKVSFLVFGKCSFWAKL